MKLNGWQRVFVVVLVVWAITAAIWATVGYAERERSAQASLLMDLIKQELPPEQIPAYRRALSTVPMNQFHGLYDVQIAAVNAKLLSPARIDVLAKNAYDMYESSADKTATVIDIVKWWVWATTIPAIMIYLLGLLVRWIVRGFAAR